MSLLHSCLSCLKQIFIPTLLAASAGCAAYAVPGRGADFQQMGLTTAQRDQQTDPAIGKLLDRKPLASFPATVAVVRIEAGDYSNPKLQTCQTGGCTVVLTHDVEKPEQFVQLARMPMLAGLELCSGSKALRFLPLAPASDSSDYETVTCRTAKMLVS